MKVHVIGAGFALASVFAAVPAHAERPDHYTGVAAGTLEAAVANFSEYNRRLEAILAKGELTANDLDSIHHLTYTLENALERINADLAQLAETLEELHLASESFEPATAKAKGLEYLTAARKVIP
jgi:hypothetical protein